MPEAWVGRVLFVLATLAFYFTVPARDKHFDYTARIAAALLHGHLGLVGSAPSWLNELVPRDGHYYSVFPLGAVLSVLPVALLQQIGVFHDYPGRPLVALIAGACVYFFFQLSGFEPMSLPRRILLALFPVFATWTWCNVGFGGAWQIALGFALLGGAASLYFSLVRPVPLFAGAFFALAVGNRTEFGLTLPIYLYLLSHRVEPHGAVQWRKPKEWLLGNWQTWLLFLVVPVVLGVLTAAYNYARFHSIFDFGYSHIPNVLKEPWYRHGLFSLHAVRWNIYKMFFEGFNDYGDRFPYLTFYPFGCSILLSSPFLTLIFREGGKLKAAAWTAIAISTFALWCHGNPGGWQFSYRYAIILLPWMFLLLLSNGPKKLTVIEVALFLVSLAVNALATYEFLWTDMIRP